MHRGITQASVELNKVVFGLSLHCHVPLIGVGSQSNGQHQQCVELTFSHGETVQSCALLCTNCWGLLYLLYMEGRDNVYNLY